MSNLKDILRELSEAPGIPGHEDEVRAILIRRLRSVADEVQVDGIGNLIAMKNGADKGPRVMLAAHMDEVGFLVRSIDSNGFIRLSFGVGHHDARCLLAQRVRIHSKGGKLLGYVGFKWFNMLSEEERNKAVDPKDLFVDIGAKSKEEAEGWGVRIGDPITFASGFDELRNSDIVLGKALDDRAGCAVMVDVMEKLVGRKHNATVYAVGTVQEEVGLRGAGVAASQVRPDIAIVLDFPYPGGDTPGIEPSELPLRMGNGVAFPLVDSVGFFGLLPNSKLVEFLEDIARENKIPTQRYTFSDMGTTDGAEIQKSGSGVPTAGLAVSGRYLHTPYVMANMRDMEYVSQLVVAAIDKIHNFKWP